jgi:hypothetical protein
VKSLLQVTKRLVEVIGRIKLISVVWEGVREVTNGVVETALFHTLTVLSTETVTI